jgi:hypothetical protein
MAKKNEPLQVPFDKDGSVMRHVGKWQTPEWRPNAQFVAILEFQDTLRSRSAVTFVFKDMALGTRHYMFLKDFTNAFKSGAFDGTIVQGVFEYVKRGTNFGTKYLGTSAEVDDE